MALRTLASRKTLAAAARPLAAAAAARGVTTVALPDLPYDYGALEPAISGEIMRLHHQKHHATYVANYNKALEQLDAAVAKGDAPAIVHLQSAIKFNGGGDAKSRPPYPFLAYGFLSFFFFVLFIAGDAGGGDLRNWVGYLCAIVADLDWSGRERQCAPPNGESDWVGGFRILPFLGV